MASLTGEPRAIAELMDGAELPDTSEPLGPVEVDGTTERLLLRVPRRDGPSLARSLHDAAAARSLKKDSAAVRIQIDPRELL
jgi:primosomal protein N' (replication factor Y)